MHHELKATNLFKSYYKKTVVSAVSLHLHNGEIVGLLGPNGAGKTTVFSMLIGLVSPDSGKIFNDHKDITRQLIHQRIHTHIGYLPQESSIFKGLNVADNIMVGLQARRDLGRKQRKNELEQLLEKFHLQDIRATLGAALSGGERRRVEIARALSGKPIFMLLDEPYAGVDPISISEMQQLISDLRSQGVGLLITDHNVRETLRICDRAYIMNAGKVIAAGDTETILNDSLVKTVYLGNQFSV